MRQVDSSHLSSPTALTGNPNPWRSGIAKDVRRGVGGGGGRHNGLTSGFHPLIITDSHCLVSIAYSMQSCFRSLSDHDAAVLAFVRCLYAVFLSVEYSSVFLSVEYSAVFLSVEYSSVFLSSSVYSSVFLSSSVYSSVFLSSSVYSSVLIALDLGHACLDALVSCRWLRATGTLVTFIARC